MLRAGIIGAGAAGAAHARALGALGDRVHLVGVHDAAVDHALALAGVLGAEVFADVDTLLGEVDLVLVCSPVGDHAEHVVRAAARGVDVLVERPAVPRSTDVARLHGAIARADRRPIVQAGHRAVFDPAFRGLVRASAPYDVVEVQRAHHVPRVTGAPSVEEILFDELCCVLTLTHAAPTSIQAIGRRRKGGGALEHCSALLGFASGASATIHVGHLTTRVDRTGRVRTTTGDVLAEDETLVDPHRALVAQAASFLDAVDRRSIPLVPLAAALPVLELWEQVLRRADLGERSPSSAPRRVA